MAQKSLCRVMTTDDPEWWIFLSLFGYALGNPDDSRCAHDHRHAIAALQALGCDVEESLAFFREQGGYCDCEIMLNIAAADA